MKTIALVPIKNEGWVLDTFISSLLNYVDEVIILNDHSTDTALDKYRNNKKILIRSSKSKDTNMSHKRNELLELGRENYGTHFVFLDADEIFSNNFLELIEDYLSKLKEGEKIFLPWINLLEEDKYSEGDEKNYKDFIFCDDDKSNFGNKFLSEPRTPISNGKEIKIPIEEGCVIHFQYLPKKRVQMKQAWYRCIELIEGKRNAKRINATYLHTREKNMKDLKGINEKWIPDNITMPNIISANTDSEFLDQIFKLFDKHTIEFFEPLDIWHIKELEKEFIYRTGRKPVSRNYPKFILMLNDIKNKIKNEIFS